MYITEKAMQAIHDGYRNATAELGGILGSGDGIAVSHIQFDRLDRAPAHPCSYAPNVDFLNHCIADWQEQGIAFKGLFHSHFGSAASLSSADRQYVHTIMRAMPEHIQSLFFPIYVLPQGSFAVFRADREGALSQEELLVLG